MKSASTTASEIGKGRIDGAGVEIALEGEVVAKRWMNHRCCRVERGPHVRHRIEFLIFDRDNFGRVFRERAAARHNRGDRFALPAHAVDRDGVLRRGFEALQMRKHADPRRDDGRKLLAGHDGDDA